MARITIVGAGITGLAIASALSRHHDITIIARDLPSDEATTSWASPWAGALFVPSADIPPEEQRMQMESFAVLWRLAITNPESSVKRIELHDMEDYLSIDKIWYAGKFPKFRVLRKEECPEGVELGMSYRTVIMNPGILLPWLRQRLERSGVVFKRMHLNALEDAKVVGHDVLVNATGTGPLELDDVRDQEVKQVRGQTILVRSAYDKAYIRHGADYTYAIPRLDGTVIIGGIRQEGSTDTSVDIDLAQDIVRRINRDLPHAFPAKLEDVDVVMHNVGFRPERSSGLRIAKEELRGQTVVHAYGVAGAGYVYCFGAANTACKLIDEAVHRPPQTKL